MRLIPTGDWHLGSRACDEKKLDALLQWILKKEDTYLLGMGDYVDAVIRQDLKRFTGTTIKEELLDVLDSLLNEQRDTVIKKLKPLAERGKILGLACGNHEDTIKRNYSFDIMADICKSLNVPFLGYSFIYKLGLKKKNNGTRRTIDIYGHHGWSSCRTSGGSLNQLERTLGEFDVDMVLMGHDHQKVGKRIPRMRCNDNMRMVARPIVLARTGSFLKTYIEGDTTYSERKAYRTTDLGVVRIDIRFQGDNKDIDIHVSE